MVANVSVKEGNDDQDHRFESRKQYRWRRAESWSTNSTVSGITQEAGGGSLLSLWRTLLFRASLGREESQGDDYGSR